MRLNPDGTLTIPENLRHLAGLEPGCPIELHIENGRIWLARAGSPRADRRAEIHAAIASVAGSANANQELSTDDILGLTRGE